MTPKCVIQRFTGIMYYDTKMCHLALKGYTAVIISGNEQNRGWSSLKYTKVWGSGEKAKQNDSNQHATNKLLKENEQYR